MLKNQAVYSIHPVLTERHCGGWLAITPIGCPLGIGVTAGTRTEAETKFQDELERFSKIRERVIPAHQKSSSS